jgi:predicted dehydrogenase
VVAICDIDEHRLKKCAQRWKIQKTYKDYREMLTKEKLDILSICTPVDTHYPILKEAIKNKNIKAIFCEKPMAKTISQAEKMIELCEENNIILQVDYQRRFDSLHNKLKRVINDKKYGKVQQVNFYYTGGICNTGSHMFDLLRFLFGEINWIEGFFSRNPSVNPDDPNIDGIMRFKNGLMATFQACEVKQYLIFELNCFLEKGRIVLKNSGFAVDFWKVGKSRYFSGYKELCNSKFPFKTDYKRNFMVSAVEHLVKCIKEEKESVSSGKDGLATLKMTASAINSAENKGKRIILS